MARFSPGEARSLHAIWFEDPSLSLISFKASLDLIFKIKNKGFASKFMKNVFESNGKFAFLSTLILLSFSGCASVPKIEADRAVTSQIKRIAVLDIQEPARISVVNIGGAPMAFGMIGGLIQGSINAENSKEFAAAVKEENISFAKPLQQSVMKALEEDGFVMTDATGQKPKLAADGKSDDYSDVVVNADAMLSLWFGEVGYMSSTYSSHYQPWVVVKARLMDAKTKKDIYFKTFAVGYEIKLKNAELLPADPKMRFSSFVELKSKKEEAIKDLLLCEEIAVKQIQTDLKFP